MPTSPLTFVIDSNVLIDLINGEVLEPFFQLDATFISTDLVLDEMGDHDSGLLLACGLHQVSLPGTDVQTVMDLRAEHRRLSIADISAYVAAQRHGYALLTGDGPLRALMTEHGGLVHGTLWVLDSLLEHGLISTVVAVRALTTILLKGSRLPHRECEKRFDAWHQT